MAKQILRGAIWALAAYFIGAFGGGRLVSIFSSNQHDRSLEAAMTGAFVLGPMAAIVGFVAEFVTKRKQQSPDATKLSQ